MIDAIYKWAFKQRQKQIKHFIENPIEVQKEVFDGLISKAKNTEWGKKYDYNSIKNTSDFNERIPLSTYEEFFPYINRLLKGEKDLLWPGKVSWFSKSSGTTNAKSKFIPVTTEALKDCHFKGGKDMISLYFANYNFKKVFKGKNLSIGGTHQINPENPTSRYGDVSAVIMQNLPAWAKFVKTPSTKISVMENWDEKLEAMATECAKVNVTSMAGVPTWTMVLIQKILEKNPGKTILDIWPNLELFMHGAVSFEPYREVFKNLIPSAEMNYQEVYNASEGFFGIQNDPSSFDMLLMLDYGVYYEFIPMDSFGNEEEHAIGLEQVELNKNYALVISTNAGLWRYKIGDCVRFTSLSPYKIRITGRTKHFINAFGEELVIENADQALQFASEKTNALISNYTAAPVYQNQEGKSGCHEWLIEFEKKPADMHLFNSFLDQRLKELNSDYEAKRYNNYVLTKPLILEVKKGGFNGWLKSKGKQGGQYKIPRLSNDRIIIDEIKAFLT